MMWRSLDQITGAAVAPEWREREFPEGAAEWPDGVSRRGFLQIVAASAALAGATACTRQPLEKIVPYVRQPELVLPGEPLYFASAHLLGGYARGVVVESHEGRPTKIEGNPDHPASLGATDVFMQASILDLYDPDRSKNVVHGGQPSTWEDFQRALADALTPLLAKRGAGLRILTEVVTSPTLTEQMRTLLERLPEMRWDQYDPLRRGNAREGAASVFGESLDAVCHFDKADVVVALDADFLSCGPASLRYARDFAERRRGSLQGRDPCRLFVAEPAPTITGAMADERLPLRAGEIRFLAAKLLAGATGTADGDGWLDRAVRALQRHRKKGLVVAGDDQPPEVHALALRLNVLLGNAGETVTYLPPADRAPAQSDRVLARLADELRSGQVEVLLMLGGNPVYHAPGELAFSEALDHAAFRAHLASFEDETSIRCQWHVPEAHDLEAWGDARAFDGTVSVIQPLIEPLYGGRSGVEMVAVLLGDPSPNGCQIVRQAWLRKGVNDQAWRKALSKGVIEAAPAEPKAAKIAKGLPVSQLLEQHADGLEISFRPDSNVLDGSYANNAWLQELPRPTTKLCWDNAVLVSPATAAKRQWKTGDLLEMAAGKHAVKGPVLVVPGHADDALTVHIGYGRTNSGRIGTGVGFSASAIRTVDSPFFSREIAIRVLGEKTELVFTQHHHQTEGRDILRTYPTAGAMAKAKAYLKDHPAPGPDETLFRPEEFAFPGYGWGMVIDLNTCIGCNACVIACQAENNVPVVGKEEVKRGREMQWIRIDRYWEGDPENPRTYFQPVPCMHCENAPCELVCPVGATVTDHEGLNVQVYNRCIGTRYCSNNCPYKVRRFNFLEYGNSDLESGESRRLRRNPNVTVRTRGVMEKCTYCLQRVSRGRIRAKGEDRKIRDGEIVPACAQACPAAAITFGDAHDPGSRVAQLKAHPFNYQMLAELNTRPRTSYLARLTAAGEEGPGA